MTTRSTVETPTTASFVSLTNYSDSISLISKRLRADPRLSNNKHHLQNDFSDNKSERRSSIGGVSTNVNEQAERI